MLSSFRVRFLRGDGVKYISHLDMMKVFERAIRRARIPIAYSHGFNPHSQMVFGLPLSVGVTSEAEYADFQINGVISPEEFADALNNQLPSGLKILECKVLTSKDNIMKIIAFAAYNVSLKLPNGDIDINVQNKINSFINRTEIITKKEGKNGIKNIDIRPMIKACEIIIPGEGNLLLKLLLSAGSEANLKPELFMGTLNNESKLCAKITGIHRTGLYVNKNGKMISPIDEEIIMGI